MTSYSLYRQLHKLPLSVFIDVSCDGDLSPLCYQGEAPENVLLATWLMLVEQYGEMMGGAESDMKHTLQVEILRLQHKMTNSRKMLEILVDYPVPQFALAVNSMLKTSFAFNRHYPEQYEQDLKGAYSCTKEMEMKLELKTEALQAMAEKEAKEGGRPDRTYYEKILINLSDWKGRTIEESVSTSKFCIMVQQYNAYVQRQKK